MRGVTKKPKAKGLGALIDKLYGFDQKITAQEAVLKKLKTKRALKERKLLNIMQDNKLEKAAGKRGAASVSRRDIPTIKNPHKFQQYVRKRNAYDLYQNRISSKAYFARLEEGEAVPGVEIFKKVSVSIRKRG
jgi:bifunctional DNA-binding transcriptional regulator/antitoxin component of YhaV-PrlF toxin-antitoxin module